MLGPNRLTYGFDRLAALIKRPPSVDVQPDRGVAMQMNSTRQAPLMVILSALMIGLWGCDFRPSEVNQSATTERVGQPAAVSSDTQVNTIETLGPVAQRADDVRRLQSMDAAESAPSAYHDQRQASPRM